MNSSTERQGINCQPGIKSYQSLELDVIPAAHREGTNSKNYKSGVQGALSSGHPVRVTIPQSDKFQRLKDNFSSIGGGRSHHGYTQIPQSEESAPAAMRQTSVLKEVEDFFFDKEKRPFSKTFPAKEEPAISLPTFSIFGSGSKSEKPTSVLARDVKKFAFIGTKSEVKKLDRVANESDRSGEKTPLLLKI